MNTQRVVAVIPAKGYSGRVPDKNFRPFYQNKSLLELKITQCKNSDVFDEIYVSSDDQRAEVIAKKMGVNFIVRDKKFCLDSTPWYEVLEGVLVQLPEKDDVIVAWCPVTSPLFCRYNEVLNKMKDEQVSGINSIATVTPLKHYYLNDHYTPMNHQWGRWAAYSQKIPYIYQLNMACNVAPLIEMKACGFHVGSRPAFFHTEVWEGLDIDTLEEFELAQWYFTRYFGGVNV